DDAVVGDRENRPGRVAEVRRSCPLRVKAGHEPVGVLAPDDVPELHFLWASASRLSRPEMKWSRSSRCRTRASVWASYAACISEMRVPRSSQSSFCGPAPRTLRSAFLQRDTSSS